MKLCVTCVKARGLTYIPLIPGAGIGSMSDFSDWTVTSDRVISL